MTKQLRSSSILIAATVFVCWAAAAPSLEAQVEGDPIDVAIALDVSGTMKGLIDSTRLNIWEIVNELAEAEPTPTLRVALITYGNQRGSRTSGWVRVETGLTEDLDLVSDRLFRLRSRGADEMVGRALQTALEKLAWSDSEHALKLLFIAGNEPADQDPLVNFRDMSDEARRKGIFVHAIFCGQPEHELAETWKELADRAQGQFASIDHRSGTVVVESPVDAELGALSAAINETFLPLGEEGVKRQEGVLQQDANAQKLSPAAAASRALVKASPLYSAEWDLVDALAAGKVDLVALQDSELPESLRGMSDTELALYLDEVTFARQALRQRIAELGEQRRRYVVEQMKARGLDDARAFDTAVRRALRERLAEKGW